MSVVQFRRPEPDEETETTIHGAAKCVGCRHEWEAVAPEGTRWLECPSCGTLKGTWVHPVGAQPGDLEFECKCGCEALTAYKSDGHFWLRCMACGVDQTSAIFGE